MARPRGRCGTTRSSGFCLAADAATGATALYDAGDEARLAELIRIRDLLGLSLADLRAWAAADDARAVLRERWAADPSDADRAQIAAEAREPLDTQLALVRARRAALEELEDELVSKRRRMRDVLRELDEGPSRSDAGGPIGTSGSRSRTRPSGC